MKTFFRFEVRTKWPFPEAFKFSSISKENLGKTFSGQYLIWLRVSERLLAWLNLELSQSIPFYYPKIYFWKYCFSLTASSARFCGFAPRVRPNAFLRFIMQLLPLEVFGRAKLAHVWGFIEPNSKGQEYKFPEAYCSSYSDRRSWAVHVAPSIGCRSFCDPIKILKQHQ